MRRQKKLPLLCLWVMCFAGCAAGLPSNVSYEDVSGPRPTQKEAVQSIQYMINHCGFRDPSSVQIKNVKIDYATYWRQGFLFFTTHYVYGWEITFEYNAKNGYGGYNGFTYGEILRKADGSILWKL